ncbi:hypothetical protein H0H93_012828 [Arthromyces matolae]|nr:hypothetical protein H0H93_012828 [Arthromyces matolae]
MAFSSYFSALVATSALIGSAAAAQTSGSFSLLTYNVAGLPELLSSGNPVVDTPLISPRLKPYNIINVQEDFNYHADLYASDTHAYRTPTSGGAGIGSGLNTLSDFPYYDLDRVKWNDCDIDSGDCLTPKGFTFARLRVSDGLWIDLYNLHADAGDEAGDISARASNLAQLTSYAETASVGMPVVIMGDTNTRYTRVGDSESLHSLINALGVSDAWVTFVRQGSYPVEGADALVCDFPFAAGTTQAQMVACEVVDKFFLRGSPAVTFKSFTFTNEDNAATTLTLAAGEYVTSIQACEGVHTTTRIFWASFTTNLGHTLTGGVATDDCLTTTVPTDAAAGGAHWGLVGFWGRSADEVDRFGAIWGAAY